MSFKDQFMTLADLKRELPWSLTTLKKMVHDGIFVPMKCSKAQNSRWIFWRSQIEEALEDMARPEKSVAKKK